MQTLIKPFKSDSIANSILGSQEGVLMPYNLASLHDLLKPCLLEDLGSWYAAETMQVPEGSIRLVLQEVGKNLEEFIHWPERALLLWKGCNRVPPTGKTRRYHAYTVSIRTMARVNRFALDGRPNGPAIAAYCLAGGERPDRFGSSNKWSIHHVYSGKFPYINRSKTTHAAKEGYHFSQSAGLIAAHPITDGLADEFPFFAWRLRAEAFIRFNYDPDGVFSATQNELGFSGGPIVEIVEPGVA